MTPREKLLNEFLFAPSRYLDRVGNVVHAGPIMNFVSAPQVKTGALATLAGIFAVAASGNENLLPLTFLTGVLATGLNFRRRANTFNLRDRFIYGQKLEYYFDTNPKKKMPVTDSRIVHDLAFEQRNLYGRLKSLRNTSILAFPLGATIFYLTEADPIRASILSAVVVGTSGVVNATNYVAKAWRSSQALNGNWNVLTAKPEKQKAENPLEVFTAAPQASPG